MSDLPMGIYRHYRGPLYQVLGLAHDANDEGRTCVVYIGLQLDTAHLGPRLAVRTRSDFDAYVYPDGAPVRETATALTSLQDFHESGVRRRFQYLGPELTAEMLSDRLSVGLAGSTRNEGDT